MKRAGEWLLSDIEALVTTAREEDVAFELKRDLQTPDGASGWRRKRSLHAYERDGLAKEIVAFANSYGGTLVLGVDESADVPSRAVALAEPIPDINTLVDRLRTAMGSLIDPPIVGLEIFGIHVGDGQDGYLVVTVPASPYAPHGFGRPPAAYSRRDSRSEPMTMRDMQSTFWESRTRRERVDAECEARRAEFDHLQITDNNIAFYFAIVSEQIASMPDLARELRGGGILRSLGAHTVYGHGVAETPWNTFRWVPTATGVRYEGEGDAKSAWEIDDTGVISVVGEAMVHGNSQANVSTFHPAWFSKTAGATLGIANALSRHYEIGGDWILAGTFRSPATRLVASLGAPFGDGDQQVDLRIPARFRPMRVTNDEAARAVLEDRIWATFGLLRGPGNLGLASGLREIEQMFP